MDFARSLFVVVNETPYCAFTPMPLITTFLACSLAITFELKNWKLAKKERCLQFFPSTNIPTHAFENFTKVTHTSCIPFTC